MQKVFNFTIEPRRNVTMHVQSYNLHNSWVVSLRFWMITSHFRKFGGRYTSILKLQVKFISGIEFNVSGIINKQFSSKHHDRKLEIVPWL